MKNQCCRFALLILCGLLMKCACPCENDPILPGMQKPDKLEQIRTNLLNNTPNYGGRAVREQILMELDEILKVPTSRDSGNVFEFYASMMQKVNRELQVEVTAGIRIWMMYNHGFIVKTPETVFAFDLIDGYSGWQDEKNYELPDELINRIDVLFVSHEHVDHTDPSIMQKIRANGKFVIDSDEIDPGFFDRYQVVAHHGQHSVETLIFEVTTSNGYKIVHTGDNQTSEVLPSIDQVDVLLLNAWVNESGTTYSSEGMRNCIRKLKPEVMIPGHIHELWHGPNSRTWYKWSLFYVDDGSISATIQVMAWGEGLDFIK